MDENETTRSLLVAIANYAYSVSGNLHLGHLATDAVNGDAWAIKQIADALAGIETTRPDGSAARSFNVG